MNFYEELTDEELLSLIETTESQGLLTAPRELESSVLSQCTKLTPTQSKPSRQKQFAAYCVRVGLATAASLALLFGAGPAARELPKNGPELTISQRFNQFTDQIEGGYQDISQRLSQFGNQFHFGGNET